METNKCVINFTVSQMPIRSALQPGSWSTFDYAAREMVHLTLQPEWWYIWKNCVLGDRTMALNTTRWKVPSTSPTKTHPPPPTHTHANDPLGQVNSRIAVVLLFFFGGGGSKWLISFKVSYHNTCQVSNVGPMYCCIQPKAVKRILTVKVSRSMVCF